MMIREKHEEWEDQWDTYDRLKEEYGSSQGLFDELVSRSPVMRNLMNAAQVGLGDYAEPPDGGWSYADEKYWEDVVKPHALRAMGIHKYGEEARRRMRPDSPDLTADQLHSWVWEAAALFGTREVGRRRCTPQQDQ